MIGLEDIAGISSPEEGRVVALALWNQLQRLQPQWTEGLARNIKLTTIQAKVIKKETINVD